MTDEEIMATLWGPQSGGSHRRAGQLVQMLLQAPTDQDFWRIFQIGWNSCDDTWHQAADLLKLLRRRGCGAAYLQGEDRAFFDALPKFVTIFRGCSAERVRGLAWSTDRNVAMGFARGHRGIPVPRPILATALIPRTAIFSVATDRGECELVVNWRKLRQLSVEPI